MIRFTAQPTRFTPINEGVIYKVEMEEWAEMRVEIIDQAEEQIIGVKNIPYTEQATIDIAPYIVGRIELEPMPAYGNTIAPYPTATYYIRVTTPYEQATSDPVTVSINLEPFKSVPIQTILGNNRIISFGEQDDILLTPAAATEIDVQMISDLGESLTITAPSIDAPALLHIDTTAFNEATKTLNLHIRFNGELKGIMHYNFVARHKGSKRVMWLMPNGSIEHHTFAATLSEQSVVNRQRLCTTADGARARVTESFERATIRSAALGEELTRALMTIISAPRVWIEGQMPTPTQVTDEILEIAPYTDAGVITLNIDYNHKTITL